MSVLPPYAMPFASTTRDVAASAGDPFAAPSIRRLPYVPPEARVVAVTAVVDAPDAAALVPGARLDTPLHVPTIASGSETLPSIDQFLLAAPDEDGTVTMAALFAEPAVEPETEETHTVDGSVATEGDEPWAIADATEAVAELADGLAGQGSGSAMHAVDVEPETLEPWTDDERWMDIMPALQSPGGPDLAGETAWARAFAEPPAPLTPAALPAGDAAAAAALAAALAALLGAGS
jgi:hypothetical protein